MKVAILTREFPPDVYGGAGVHVDFLVRELRRMIDVDVHCMGEPRKGATAHSEDDLDKTFEAASEWFAGTEGG